MPRIQTLGRHRSAYAVNKRPVCHRSAREPPSRRRSRRAYPRRYTPLAHLAKSASVTCSRSSPWSKLQSDRCFGRLGQNPAKSRVGNFGCPPRPQSLAPSRSWPPIGSPSWAARVAHPHRVWLAHATFDPTESSTTLESRMTWETGWARRSMGPAARSQVTRGVSWAPAGSQAPEVLLGSQAAKVLLGSQAAQVLLGSQAARVLLGSQAARVLLGSQAPGVPEGSTAVRALAGSQAAQGPEAKPTALSTGSKAARPEVRAEP
jgi:hypothetical protein